MSFHLITKYFLFGFPTPTNSFVKLLRTTNVHSHIFKVISFLNNFIVTKNFIVRTKYYTLLINFHNFTKFIAPVRAVRLAFSVSLLSPKLLSLYYVCSEQKTVTNLLSKVTRILLYSILFAITKILKINNFKYSAPFILTW